MKVRVNKTKIFKRTYREHIVKHTFVGLSGHIFVVPRFPSKSGLIHKHIVKHRETYRETYRETIFKVFMGEHTGEQAT